jgi:MOSC domain-containing protein
MATLDRLRSISPQSRFDVARFRPNIVIQTTEENDGFVENDWVGRYLAIGSDLRLAISDPWPRCVMTTLPQGDLPKAPNVLRTIVQHNYGNVGVLAMVTKGGRVARGDTVTLE